MDQKVCIAQRYSVVLDAALAVDPHLCLQSRALFTSTVCSLVRGDQHIGRMIIHITLSSRALDNATKT